MARMKVGWWLGWWLCLGAAGCAARAEASRPEVAGAPQLHAHGGDSVAAVSFPLWLRAP